MITSKQCLDKFGAPEKESSMVLWDVPKDYEIGAVPNKIYCNKLMLKPLEKALFYVKTRKLAAEIKTWDGCFNIRKKKGNASPSLHSWGLAIDINAAWNGYNKPVTMSKELVQCFKDAGFDWGGDWGIKDGMHFQLAAFPNKG